MLQRHLSWAAQLSRAAAAGRLGRARLWLLIDETYGGSAARRRVWSLASAAGLGEGELAVLAYTEADLLSTFPVIEELRAAIPDRPDVCDCFTLPCQKSLAWGYHVEPILLWWSRVAGSAEEPAFAWVLEDDAGYSGDLASFVLAYRERGEDLVAHGFRRVEADWVWCETASPAFLRLAAPAARLRCSEHVQRFSAQLLRRLQSDCLAGISAWSEMSVPTLCHAAGLWIGPLHPDHIGAVFAFDGKVPEAVWPGLLKRPDTRDRWWHALKW